MKILLLPFSFLLVLASCSSGNQSAKELEQVKKDSIEANKAYEAEREAQQFLRDSVQRIASDTIPESV